MATTIKLSDNLIQEARRYGGIYSRSVPKQIEYWSRIGKIAEENPDLSYSFIKEILIAGKAWLHTATSPLDSRRRQTLYQIVLVGLDSPRPEYHASWVSRKK